MLKHKLGCSDLEVSPLGLGCWAIGGPYTVEDEGERVQMGWGAVDDAESVRAIHRALELGVNFFDTANVYGTGRSERVLGRALAGRWQEALICTKFATVFDEEERVAYYGREMEINRTSLRETCAASLRRLGSDYIDLYLLHAGEYPPAKAPELVELLEELVREGKIRWYGWSTDRTDRPRAMSHGAHFAAVEYRLNWLFDAPEIIALCDELGLGSIIKIPLNSGTLTGKFNAATTFAADDGRQGTDFSVGRGAARLKQVAAVRDILTRDGRTMAQGALAWIWTRNPSAIPIPGFKRAEQVEENAAAPDFPLLTAAQMQAISSALAAIPLPDSA